MFDFMARPRFLLQLVIALCAVTSGGVARGQQQPVERTVSHVAPVIDGNAYRQAMAERRLPPVHGAAALSSRPPVVPASVAGRLPSPQLLQKAPGAEPVSTSCRR